MGARTTDTLNDIERLRSRLDRNLAEIERRLPPAAQLGRRALAVALGGGAGGSALWFAVRKLKPKKKSDERPDASAPVVVNVFPKAIVPVALGAVAVWAGVRLYEAKMRSQDPASERSEPAVVRPMSPARDQGIG